MLFMPETTMSRSSLFLSYSYPFIHIHRINVGGMNSNVYMQKLIQLKHPGLALAVTVNRTQVSLLFLLRPLICSRRHNVARTHTSLKRSIVQSDPFYVKFKTSTALFCYLFLSFFLINEFVTL